MEVINQSFAQCRLPFPDPDNDEEKLIRLMLERIAALDSRWRANGGSLSVDMERHPKQLAVILKRTNYHFESAMNEWEQWKDWRRLHKADNITTESVKELIASGIAEWKGKDKGGRPLLLITGRKLVASVPRQPLLFRQFIIYLAENGLQNVLHMQSAAAVAPASASMDRTAAVESTVPTDGQIVIIYDRRGLLFENIDINLYRDCREVLGEVRRFYSDRLHCMYILYMTWGHWAMYYLFIKPLLGLSGSANKFLAADAEEDLLPFFHQDTISQLHPFYSGRRASITVSSVSTDSTIFSGGIRHLPVIFSRQGDAEPSSTTLPDAVPTAHE